MINRFPNNISYGGKISAIFYTTISAISESDRKISAIIFFPTHLFYLSRNFPQPGLPSFARWVARWASAPRLVVTSAPAELRVVDGRGHGLTLGSEDPGKMVGFFQVSWFPLGKAWVGFGKNETGSCVKETVENAMAFEFLRRKTWRCV